jgi:hypothetical protein
MALCGNGCSTLEEFLVRVGTLLADPDHVTWSQGELISSLNEGLCDLQHRRPDAFIETVSVPLQPGSAQTIPEGYTALVELKTNLSYDTQGNVIEGRTISAVNARYAHILKNRRCLAAQEPSSYSVGNATKDTFDETSFNVTPPVPYGTSAFVRATLIKKPIKFTAAKTGLCLGVDCKFESVLTDYVLFRSYGVLAEDKEALTAAAYHRKSYEEFMAKHYEQASRFGSGFYTGVNANKPGADENFRRH